MSAKSADEVRGFEFDWIASDADGNVALFSTAGGGYAPEEFLRDTEAHDEAIRVILAAPPSTRARFAPRLPDGLKNTWKMVAERGLFAFDSDPNGGPYNLVAVPESASLVADLPVPAAVVVRRLVLPTIRFREVDRISDDLLKR